MSGPAVTVDDLVGTWVLVDWRSELDGAHHGHPMGADAVGQLLYGADGGVAAALSFADRAAFGTTQLHKGTADQRDLAALTYVSYAGRWRLDGDRVHHQVDLSLFPDWVGTVLVRWAQLEGDRLVLRTEPEVTGAGEVVNVLTWQRLSPPG